MIHGGYLLNFLQFIQGCLITSFKNATLDSLLFAVCIMILKMIFNKRAEVKMMNRIAIMRLALIQKDFVRKLATGKFLIFCKKKSGLKGSSSVNDGKGNYHVGRIIATAK